MEILVGDATLAKEKLGWEAKVTLEELVKEMVKSDLNLFKRDQYLIEGGYSVMKYNE